MNNDVNKKWLFDTHVHFNPDDVTMIGDVVDRAVKAGVNYFIAVGGNMKVNNFNFVISEKYKGRVFSAFGLDRDTISYNAKCNNHIECIVKEFSLWIEKKKESFVAIGETGIDKFYCKDTVSQQAHLTEVMLNMAIKYEKPVILHCREAWPELKNIIKNLGRTLQKIKLIWHCFTAGVKELSEAIEYGMYLGITGIISFKNTKAFEETLKLMPLTSILLETDSPYLTPEPYRGKKNEPQYLPFIARHVSRILDMGYEDVVELTTNNAFRCFGIEGNIRSING